MTMKTQPVAEKVVQRGNFIVINVFLKKKKEKNQINNLNYHLKELEKEQSKVNRRK